MKSGKHRLGFVIISLMIFIPSIALAQTGRDTPDVAEKKFELGGQFTYMRRKDPNIGARTSVNLGFVNGPENPGSINELGFGARLGYNLSKHVAIEAEANFFPEDKRSPYIIGVPLRVIEP